MRKTYVSFDEITHDLKVLEIEKDLYFQKIFSSVDEIKEDLSPDRLLKNSLGSITNYVTSSGTFQAFIITRVLKLFFNRRK